MYPSAASMNAAAVAAAARHPVSSVFLLKFLILVDIVARKISSTIFGPVRAVNGMSYSFSSPVGNFENSEEPWKTGSARFGCNLARSVEFRLRKMDMSLVGSQR